jgi:molybdopterin-guanine dinucleotide biosynthesis protein A
MGGGDKTLRLLAGRPMLDHVLERLQPQVAAIALNANGDPARFARWGLTVIPDTIEGHPGPLAGLLAGMEWAQRCNFAIANIVTVPADTPFIPRDLVENLERARDGDIVIASSETGPHWAIGLWPVRLASLVRAAMIEDGLRKVSAFAARHRYSFATYGQAEPDPFFNVNDSRDLEAAEAMAGLVP